MSSILGIAWPIMSQYRVLILLALGGYLSGCGGGSSSPPVVDPPPQNQAPAANAGADQSVDEGTALELAGVGTDSDGTIASYSWQQDSGTATLMSNSDTANASFIAPEVPGSEDLVFRLTVTDNDGASASDLVTITVRDVHDIDVIIREPQANAIWGAELKVVATVSSAFDVVEVRAIVADREGQLIYSADSGKFEGVVTLEGLARGAQTLEVMIKDAAGEEARFFRTFVFDKKPELTVSAPLDNNIAMPLHRVTASCTDDDPAGCEIVVSDLANKELFRGRDSIDTEIDFSAYRVGVLTIIFKATDSAGQVTELSRRIYVETSTFLSEVFTVSGDILDVQGSGILHKIAEDNGDRLEVIDWVNETTAGVPVPAGSRIYELAYDKPLHQAKLTPYGAMFITADIGDDFRRLYDWNQGVLDEVEVYNPGGFGIAGNFAIWGDLPTLSRRDLASRSDLLVASSSPSPGGGYDLSFYPVGGDVAANGTVAYGIYTYPWVRVEMFANGVTSVLTDDYLFNSGIKTDGTRVVYTRTAGEESAAFSILLHDGSVESILHEASACGGGYQIVPGWFAYKDIGNLGQCHVWLFDSTAQRQQLTFFAESSTIEVLGENGEAMLLSGQKRYLATPEGELTEVGSDSGKAYWTDGQWYVVLGSSLFRVML